MTTSKIILLYILTASFFLAVDLVWLGIVAKKFYQKYLSEFLSAKVNWSAAMLFYLLFVVGIILFAVLPGLEEESLTRAVLYGALFGFFCYATYDLSNLATLENWPLIVTVTDIVWGSFISGLTSAFSYWIAGVLL